MRASAVRMVVAAFAVSACADTAGQPDTSTNINQPATGTSNLPTADSATAGSAGQAPARPASGAVPASIAGRTAQPAAAGAQSNGGAGASGSAAGSGTAGSAALAGGSGAAGAAGAAGTAGTTSSGCDRVCLLGMMQGYTDALVARDSSRLSVSRSLKYTENGVPAKLGETVWTSAMSIVADTTLSFADPPEKQVASQFVFAESGSAQKIYQVRLKVEEGTITEIESMVVKSGDQFFNPAGMKPEPVFLEQVEPAKRSTREELLSITELYLEYLEGTKGAADIPFDEGCKRYENGTVTASGLGSFNSQSWSFDVTHRILVVDEEAGITWGMFPFQQSESALVVGEAFKIIDGKMMMIQAVMTYMPGKAWD